jgi:hypothetical protein
LPLFFVDLKPSDNNQEIHWIETLNYSKVKFEPPRTKRNIPQSSTSTMSTIRIYPGLLLSSPRCVKCAGNHPTKQCLRIEKPDAVKCFLCEGNHPANYKGCAIYKELQKRTFTPLRDKRDEKFRTVLTQSYVNPTTSYVSTLKPQQTQQELGTAIPPQENHTFRNRKCRQVTYKNLT